MSQSTIPESGAAAPRSQRARRWSHVIAAILLVAAGAAWSLRVWELELLGWDCYPLILTCRVTSPADVAQNFTERMMEERYPGDFYRPAFNFALALEYWVGGLRPQAYLHANVLLFVLCAGALYLLFRRLGGPAANVGAVVAVIAFLVHPSHVEVVPAPARQPELLCGLFMALALWVQLWPRALQSKWPPIAPAVLGLWALSSKETGLILPVLIGLAVLLYSPATGWRGRLWRTGLALLPHAVVWIIFFAARTAVLGGLGGHAQTSLVDSVSRLPMFARGLFELVAAPQPPMRSTFAAVLGGLLACGLTLSFVMSVWRSRTRRDPDAPADGFARAGLVGLAWFVLTALTYAVAGRMQPWYLLLPVAGLAIVVGAVAEWLVRLARAAGLSARIPAGVTAALLAAVLVWHGWYSPYVQRYPEWATGSAYAREYLEGLRGRITAAPDGSIVRFPAPVDWVPPQLDRPTVFGAAVYRDYSVQAWAELEFTARKVRVTLQDSAARPYPADDEVLVLLGAPSLLPRALSQ